MEGAGQNSYAPIYSVTDHRPFTEQESAWAFHSCRRFSIQVFETRSGCRPDGYEGSRRTCGKSSWVGRYSKKKRRRDWLIRRMLNEKPNVRNPANSNERVPGSGTAVLAIVKLPVALVRVAEASVACAHERTDAFIHFGQACA